MGQKDFQCHREASKMPWRSYRDCFVVVIVLGLLAMTIQTPIFAKGACFGELQKDTSGFLDIAKGYSYETLIQPGQIMADGKAFPHRPDLNVYIPLVGSRAFLVMSHELNEKKNKAWGSGAVTRHYLVDGKIKESRLIADGMGNNCSGSLTPWGTILTNEEFPNGFIWEVDPVTGEKWKRDKMGRFSHESSVVAADGSVYLTQDFHEGLMYRFVPTKLGDLSDGKLFAYNKAAKNWVAITDPANAPQEGAKAGATPFNRLEGLALSKDGKSLYISETGDDKDPEKNDFFGRVYKMSLSDWSLTVVVEGKGEQVANPDNIIFDNKGNLWIMEDRFGKNISKYGNNQIWVLKPTGELCLFSRLRDDSCESTGPEFSTDYKTLFVNFQCDNQLDKVAKISGF